jgi:putative NADH-flavin reductase
VNLTVFGGTGPTGLLLIDRALGEGHRVSAFARTPAKLPRDPRLIAVEGSLGDSERIAAVVAGADAVISLLGPRKPYRAEDVAVLTDGCRAIVAGMQEHQVRRLVALSTPSSRDPADGNEFVLGLSVKLSRRFFPVAYDAFVKMGEVIRASGLDWTLVRVPILTNGPRTETLKVRRLGDKGGMRLSRANAAAFLLAQAADKTAYVRQSPLISNP